MSVARTVAISSDARVLLASDADPLGVQTSVHDFARSLLVAAPRASDGLERLVNNAILGGDKLARLHYQCCFVACIVQVGPGSYVKPCMIDGYPAQFTHRFVLTPGELVDIPDQIALQRMELLRKCGDNRCVNGELGSHAKVHYRLSLRYTWPEDIGFNGVHACAS